MAVEWETPGSRINRENIFMFNKNTKKKKKLNIFSRVTFGSATQATPSPPLPEIIQMN